MSGGAAVRAWLGAVIAAAVLAGIVLVALPRTEPAPAQQRPGPGQPLGAVTPAVPSTTPITDPGRGASVARLLRDRAQALLSRDERAFLSSLDPYADEDFLARQRAMFANVVSVPFGEWAYVLRPEDGIDVTALAATTGADELWAPGVDLRYALTGADLAPTSRTMGYLFARRGSTWYLRSDTALDGFGRRTWRGPWDFGPCVVITTASGIVLAHPGSDEMAQRLAAELDSSVASVSAFWGSDWSQRVALLLPDTQEEMRALVGPDFPVDSVVAVAVADRVDVDRRAVAGQRVVLSPVGSRVLSLPSLRVVLRHEILHVAARADTVDGAPMWLLEGFADYVGYRDSGMALPQGAPDLAEVVRGGGAAPSLPADKDFRADGRDLDLAYQKSWSMARFVAERFGEDRLLTLYRTLARAGKVSASQTDDMLRQAIGMDLAGLVQDWQRYLRDTLG